MHVFVCVCVCVCVYVYVCSRVTKLSESSTCLRPECEAFYQMPCTFPQTFRLNISFIDAVKTDL